MCEVVELIRKKSNLDLCGIVKEQTSGKTSHNWSHTSSTQRNAERFSFYALRACVGDGGGWKTKEKKIKSSALGRTRFGSTSAHHPHAPFLLFFFPFQTPITPQILQKEKRLFPDWDMHVTAKGNQLVRRPPPRFQQPNKHQFCTVPQISLQMCGKIIVWERNVVWRENVDE